MEAIRGNVSQAGRFGYSLVEMAFVVEQGVGGFRQGVISPLGRVDTSWAGVGGGRFLGRG